MRLACLRVFPTTAVILTLAVPPVCHAQQQDTIPLYHAGDAKSILITLHYGEDEFVVEDITVEFAKASGLRPTATESAG